MDALKKTLFLLGMSNRALRIIFLLAVVSTVLMFATQYFWVKNAYNLEKKLFSSQVTIALKNVAVQLLRMNNNNSPVDSIVNKVSDRYYTVQVNDKIDSTVLEPLLKRELLAQQIKTDFEYSVYDCESENMKYGRYVSFSNNDKPDDIVPTEFPKNKKENNYFGVHFPQLSTFLTKEMSSWFASTFVLILFMIILAYAIFIIFRQKRLSEIQKDFVNNMTHEFKTPLATIKISSEVLKNPNIINNPERLLNYATIINNETLHLTNQVERVLQMAKSGKDTISLNKEDFELAPNLEEIIDKTYKPLIRSRGGDIQLEVEDGLMIFADKLHFKNVVVNLLDNAIKYCREVPQIMIKAGRDQDQIKITIRDNGIGMSPENVKHIFYKFYRIPTGNLHDVKGFGLGLNYVKLIIKQHGGNIKVHSELDKGSEFCIFIPLKS
ncbi:MAG: HAMP domain-containing histidine kinase [Bacteroidetes bacterium]|nr:HAMP domain-containing histidine kinase [Bacteroidota bacterium]